MPASAERARRMNQLARITARSLPALVAAAGDRAGLRFMEFFAANIRNPHTRRAYARAVKDFSSILDTVPERAPVRNASICSTK